MSDPLEHVTTVDRLAQLLELREVRFDELHAVGAGEIAPDRESTVSIETAEEFSPNQPIVRFRFHVTTPDGDYLTVVTVVYGTSTSITAEPAAWRGYIEQVSFMTAYPYVREQISSLAMRLRRLVPTLPLLPRGGFQIGETDASAEAADAL